MASPGKDKRVTFLSRCVVGGFAVAALSQARVQVLNRKSIIDRATQTQRFVISHPDPARRGVIYTADGKPIAEDEDTHVLNVDFRKVPHAPSFFMELSAATGIPASEFLQLADSGLKTRTWRQPVSSAQAEQLQQVKTSWRADGISLAPSGKRSYPLAEATAGIAGVVRDGKPLGGLESGQNKALCGKNGVLVGLVDREGHILPTRLDSKTVPREDGQDITLTIDSQLQSVASSAIRQAVEDNRATQGVAIIINPKTGALLAMANWPSFDPNTVGQADGAVKYGFNPNYMATLEPGSMFKILTLAEAFDKGVIKEDQGVYCHGVMGVGKRTISCDSHHGNRAHGGVTPAMAIAKSCNISAATWALRVGYIDYVRYLERLGIMSKPHLGLPGERSGLFNYNDPSQELHLANLGFGQAVNATPVQLASALAMLANNGVRMQPHIIKKIGNHEIEPTELGQIVRPESAQRVVKIMQCVIGTDFGTGKSLRIPGYILGGKTGTAQKVNNETHSMKGGGYVANFVGFVPGDKPQAVILVMVDHPTGGKYYGADVAGPVFKALALSVINRLNIPPSANYAQSIVEDKLTLAQPAREFVSAPAFNAAEVKKVLKERQIEKERVDSFVAGSSPASILAPTADKKPARAIDKKDETNKKASPELQIVPNLLDTQTDADEAPPVKKHRRRHRKGALAQR